MKILTDDEIRQIADPIVDTPENLVEVYKVFLQMCQLCSDAGGIGLAAIQVGLPWRFFVVQLIDGTFEGHINCDYVPVGEDKELSVEGCLSIKKNGELRFFEVQRYSSVRVTGELLTEDLRKVPLDRVLIGLYSIVCQHEIDHSLKILISDIGQEIHVYQ